MMKRTLSAVCVQQLKSNLHRTILIGLFCDSLTFSSSFCVFLFNLCNLYTSGAERVLHLRLEMPGELPPLIIEMLDRTENVCIPWHCFWNKHTIILSSYAGKTFLSKAIKRRFFFYSDFGFISKECFQKMGD